MHVKSPEARDDHGQETEPEPTAAEVITQRLQTDAEADGTLLDVVSLANGEPNESLALALLHEFVAGRVAGQMPRESLIDWLAIVAAKVIDGVDPRNALGLGHDAESRRKTLDDRLLVWATVELERRNKKSLNSAVETAAEKLGKSTRTIWRELNDTKGIEYLLDVDGGEVGATPQIREFITTEDLKMLVEGTDTSQ